MMSIGLVLLMALAILSAATLRQLVKMQRDAQHRFAAATAKLNESQRERDWPHDR